MFKQILILGIISGQLWFTPVGWGGELLLPDPTMPPVVTPKANESATITVNKEADDPNRWQLSQIIVSPHKKQVVINGEVKEVGQLVGDWEVTLIEPGRIVVRHETTELSLYATKNIKTPSSTPNKR